MGEIISFSDFAKNPRNEKFLADLPQHVTQLAESYPVTSLTPEEREFFTYYSLRWHDFSDEQLYDRLRMILSTVNNVLSDTPSEGHDLKPSVEITYLVALLQERAIERSLNAS